MDTRKIASLPVLAYPPPAIRKNIGTEEWTSCLQLWETICQNFLALPPELFQAVLDKSEPASLACFLSTYMEEISAVGYEEVVQGAVHDLHRTVYLLVHRTFTHLKVPPDLLRHWTFFGSFSQAYRRAAGLSALVEQAWARSSQVLDTSLQKYKITLIKKMETGKMIATDLDQFTHCLLPLIRSCPSAGMYLLAGSDLLDTVLETYSGVASNWQSKLLLLVYLMFLSPLRAEKSNHSLLYDHLYSIRDGAEKSKNTPTREGQLLADLVTDTPFLAKASKLLIGKSDTARGEALLKSLEKFRRDQGLRARRPRRRRVDKGRESAVDSYGPSEGLNGVHVHRMSLVSQIQDLFPDLGSGFVVKLLDEYNEDVEVVTAHLLEGTLPPNLKSLDESEELPAHPPAPSDSDIVPNLVPRSTPPPSPPSIPQRRNIYDDDEFDRLAVSSSQVHFGRKETDRSIFAQDSTSRSTSKAAIMSALAAFDADDDERDDTYDIADVGGTVDTSAGPEGDEDIALNDMREKNEELLWTAWKADVKVFERDSATRKSRQREALRNGTGMTNEAIEGWAIMLQRDPRKTRGLEARYATFGGVQTQLGRTSYRRNLGAALETDSEDTEGVSSGGEATRGGHGGRGGVRRGGGQGRGFNVAGPSDEKRTQVSRHRKEANKGSRANHNRRDQRAKKMARGGLAG